MAVKLLVTQEALETKITIGDIIDMQDGKVKVIAQVLSRFVLDEATGRMMDEKAAFQEIRSLNSRELDALANQFKSLREAAIVSPTNAAS